MKKPWNIGQCKEKKTFPAEHARLNKPTTANEQLNNGNHLTEYDVLRWISEHFSGNMEDLDVKTLGSNTKRSSTKSVKPLRESCTYNVRSRTDLEINSPFVIIKNQVKSSEHGKNYARNKVFESKPEYGGTEHFIATSIVKSKVCSPKSLHKSNTRIKSANRSVNERLPITDYRKILEKENFDVSKRSLSKYNKYSCLGLEKSIQTHSCIQHERDMTEIFNSRFIKLNIPDTSITVPHSTPSNFKRNLQRDSSNLTNSKDKISRNLSANKSTKISKSESSVGKSKTNSLPSQYTGFSSSWKTNNSRVQVRDDQSVGKEKTIHRTNKEPFPHLPTIKKENGTPCKIRPRKDPSPINEEVHFAPKASLTTFQATLLRAAYRVAARKIQLQNQAEGNPQGTTGASSKDSRIKIISSKHGNHIARVPIHYWEE